MLWDVVVDLPLRTLQTLNALESKKLVTCILYKQE